MNVPLISFTSRESHVLPYHSQRIWLLALTFLFIVSVHEIETHLQDERSLEFSVMCFLPMMSRSITRPVLSPHKVLINHVDYLLTTESYILMGSLVVWSFIWFGWFFRKKAKQQKAILVQTLSLTSKRYKINSGSFEPLLLCFIFIDPSTVLLYTPTKPSSLFFCLPFCHHIFSPSSILTPHQASSWV